MGFFDLNIPYTESTKRNSTADKSTRLKLAVKAMELGYTGVAYNRTITGVMSEVDRCSISLFPLSSVLKVSPSISTAVNFHRRLLNVPTSTPFRQYTRLTVVVDTPAQGSALNSGNPVLKTYDMVAVQPMKQESFDQACRNYEVDIIAIDFSENRFRLKQPLIKAAIERGVYFEITYSNLLMDAQLRRQMISNVKFLLEWTRGKNIIFSSGAPSVTELRGPYDAANLACLLGFSMERSKAAVSKTCRSLLENSLRKKKFYKEAIRIELISPAEQTNIEKSGFDDWLEWDPISSGEGDLQLDDMAKSFAASNKESTSVKAIDFASIIDDLPSHGLHINDIISETKSEKPTAVCDVPIDAKMYDLFENDHISVMETTENGQCDISTNETVESLGGETCDMVIEEKTKIPLNMNICSSCPETEQQNPEAEEEHVSDEKRSVDTQTALPAEEIGEEKSSANNQTALPAEIPSCNLQSEEEEEKEAIRVSSDDPISPPLIELNVVIKQSKDASLCEEFLEGEEHMRVSLNEDVPEERSNEMAGDVLVVGPTTLETSSSLDNVPEEHSSELVADVSAVGPTTLETSRFHDELQNNGGDNLVVDEILEDASMEVEVEFKDHHESSSSERIRRKQGSSKRSVSFPFKRLLKPSHFKKVRKLKTKNILSLSEL